VRGGRGEKGELVGALCSWLGVVDDEHDAVGVVEEQLLAVEGEGSDLRVLEGDGGDAAAVAGVVAGPQLAEPRAGQGQ
jgi:hypothetical protein